MQGTKFPAGVWGLQPCARCAGFSMAEIGNRKERLRVREAGASAAGRGQRPYASFPDRSPKRVWAAAQRNPISKKGDVVSEQNAGHSAIETGSNRKEHVGTPKPTAVRERSET